MNFMQMCKIAAQSLCGAALCAAGQAHAETDRFATAAWSTIDLDENSSTGAYLMYGATGQVYESRYLVQAGYSYDRYFYDEGGGARARGTTEEASLLFGRAVDLPGSRLTLFAGPVHVAEGTASAVAETRARTLGARATVILEAQPLKAARLAVVGSYATPQSGYSASARLAFPLGRGLTGAPEIALTGNRNYWQVRSGPSLSTRLSPQVGVSASGGLVHHNDRGLSAYGGLGLSSSF